jgi:hypothetical protein
MTANNPAPTTTIKRILVRLMYLVLTMVTALTIVSLGSGWLSGQAQPNPETAQWTSVIASAQTPATTPVLGTDGQHHLVYELQLTNTSRLPASLKQIDVVDGNDPFQTLASFSEEELMLRLRTLGNAPAETAILEPNETRLFLVDYALAADQSLPRQLSHRLSLLGVDRPAQTEPSAMQYLTAPIELLAEPVVISPPLKGAGWVAINGCCAPNVGHRSTGLPINGKLYFAQRFAIDWMQLDDQGRLASGDLADVQSYTGYGATVLAVADGTVVSTLDALPEQRPPTLPEPLTIDLRTVLGNHVILDLGNDVFVLYAHLKPGSVAVQPGERVRRGQGIGQLGNTGNTSAPHLHLHLMAGPTLGSDGLPYTIDAFEVAGQIPLGDVEPFYSFEGHWNDTLLPQPSVRRQELPLFLNIVNFPE